MSLRIKVPLVLLAAFILNLTVLSLYYRYHLAYQVSERLADGQSSVEKAADSITGIIQGNSILELNGFQDRLTKNNIKIILENLKTKEKIFFNAKSNGFDIFSASRVVIIDGQNYLMTIKRVLNFTNLNVIDISWQILVFETVIVFFILLLIAIVLHFSYTKDIFALSKEMQGYKNKTPQEITVNRKDEIGMLQKSFNRLINSLNEEKLTQNRIIASISHDIKTPLTSVLGYSERLMKKSLPPQRQHDYLETVYEKAKSIENIVNEFDDYIANKIDLRLDMKELTAEYLASMLKDEYTADFSENGINLELVNYLDEDIKLAIDLGKMRRVFSNILSNSIRHNPSIKLAIKIVMAEEKERISISVSDNGKGVEEDSLQKIFEPLFSSDTSRKVSGLGLSICRDIVQAHGGEIQAFNNSEGGLTIKILMYKLQ